MELADHLRVMARNWWRILIVATLAGAGVYFVSDRRDEVYRAEALLTVTPAQRGSFPSSRDETLFLTDTYAERATTRPVVRDALEATGLDLSVFEAIDQVTAEVSGDVGFLTISADGPTPRQASQLANAVTRSLIEDVAEQQAMQITQDLEAVNQEIQEIAAQLDTLATGTPEREALEARYQALLEARVDRETQPTNRVDIVSNAALPSVPASPRPTRDAVLGFLVALVLAAELSVGIEALSDRLPRSEDPDAISRLFGLPVLAMLPKGADTDRSVVESFRTLRTSLAGLPTDYRPRSIAITSAHQGAGKSFTAINLARSSAAQQSGVLLVDGDLRKPAVHDRLDLAREPGLTDVLAGRSAFRALHSVGVGPAYAVGEPRRFLVLPSGPPVPDPVVALGNDAVQRILHMTDEPPNLTIIDTPPALLFGDAVATAAQCDAAIVILDARRSRVRATKNIITMLTRSGANIIGLVLNRVDAPRAGRYYHA